jgi:hypothetical protein
MLCYTVRLCTVLYSLYPGEHSSLFSMVCRNICEKIYSKMVLGQSHYLAGKKFCRRCECYLITEKVFCPCCGMQLRTSPNEGSYKQKLREEKRKLMNLDYSYRSTYFSICIQINTKYAFNSC